jgi:DNA-directed RNA polymerase specialized sigma54-like protein
LCRPSTCPEWRCGEHFKALRRRYSKIARALKLLLDRIMESVEAIMSLEPKPAHRFRANDSRYIVPDVFVYKMRGEYTTPCRGTLPRGFSTDTYPSSWCKNLVAA